MQNNVVDKVYLALELTKLCINPNENSDMKEVASTFRYFIKDLTGINNFENLDNKNREIAELRRQCEILQEDLNNHEKEARAYYKQRLDRIINYINQHGGDMECNVKVDMLEMLDDLFKV